MLSVRYKKVELCAESPFRSDMLEEDRRVRVRVKARAVVVVRPGRKGRHLGITCLSWKNYMNFITTTTTQTTHSTQLTISRQNTSSFGNRPKLLDDLVVKAVQFTLHGVLPLRRRLKSRSKNLQTQSMVEVPQISFVRV